MENFKDYSAYYDLLYQDKNYLEEAQYVQKIIRSKLPKAVSILELGSGTGKHAEIFCQNGFEVTGIERSAGMVKQSANRNINGFNVYHGDISKTMLNRTFDTVVSLFHVISYLTQMEDLEQTFKLTYGHLNPGGLFIFDTWYKPAVLYQQPEERTKKLENKAVLIERLAKPSIHKEKNMVVVQYDIAIKNKETNQSSSFKEMHPVRYFSIDDIKKLATERGFVLLKAEEFLTAKNLSNATWSSCFILQKPFHD